MRKIEKKVDSKILSEKLQYPNHKKQILSTLEAEQGGYCAYTEEYFSAGYAIDVEHFAPTLKDTPQDSYHNWFAVSHKFNQMKGTKNAISRWNDFQPLIHPTQDDFEERILYDTGDYIAKPDDLEAKNLIEYLNLNYSTLSIQRKQELGRLKALLASLNNNIPEFAKHLKEFQASPVNFPRMIREEFGVEL